MKRGATTTPLIVPSAKFQKNRHLALLSQGLQRLKSDRRLTAVLTAVLVFRCLLLHFWCTFVNVIL